MHGIGWSRNFWKGLKHLMSIFHHSVWKVGMQPQNGKNDIFGKIFRPKGGSTPASPLKSSNAWHILESTLMNVSISMVSPSRCTCTCNASEHYTRCHCSWQTTLRFEPLTPDCKSNVLRVAVQPKWGSALPSIRDWFLFVCFSWRYEATEGPRVNFVMREALFEIYTWILCRTW